MAATAAKRPSKSPIRRPKRQMQAKEIISVVPEQAQKKIFEGDVITLDGSIGTCLNIEFSEWKPMFKIGGVTHGLEREKARG